MRFAIMIGWFVSGAISVLGASEPLSVSQSLARFKIQDNLKIECVAHEPLVVDPVAIRFDPKGRMWVVEMRDYPHGPADGKPPQSRIRVLTDTNRDGVYDQAVTFADRLLFCTGLQLWQDGALVTLAGKIAFFRDTDGDLRADEIETWYQGFAEQNSQLRANHPRLGLDHFVYVANGLRGGSVIDARKADAKPESISGRDFRFNPKSGDYQATSGLGQFGLTFDNQGNRFVCSNRNPLRHIVLENRYLARAPKVAVRAVIHDAAKSGFESRVFAISSAWTTSNLHGGQFTAACGLIVYRGNNLGPKFIGNAFICEPTGSLVHREIIQKDGATFSSRSAYDRTEFLASDDDWFRPVNTAIGPDGTLYVVDMYRAVIEHPQFMPTELKERPDMRRGDDRGRIYRISKAKSDSNVLKPLTNSLPDFSTPKHSVQQLKSRNSWNRETAARLLIEANGLSAAIVEQLADFILHPSSSTAQARMHAIWLLHSSGKLEEPVLLQALSDSHGPVRRQAILVAEHYLEHSPNIKSTVMALHLDSDPKVRFQTALSLTGQTDVPAEVAASIATRAINDPWTRDAARLLAATQPLSVLHEVTDKITGKITDRPDALAVGECLRQLAQDAAKTAPMDQLNDSIPRLLGNDKQEIAIALAVGISNGLASRRVTWAQFAKQDPSGQIEKQWQQVISIAKDLAANVIESNRTPRQTDQWAFELLGYQPKAETLLLKGTLPDVLPNVRKLAIGTLVRTGSDQAWQMLLNNYSAESPAFRRLIVDGLLARQSRTLDLLEALEDGSIKLSGLDRVRVNRLLKHSNKEIRDRTQKLAKANQGPDRSKLFAQYTIAVNQGGDATRGKEVFKRQCATCHKVADTGINVGPDISDSRVKTASQFLTDILFPNQAIDNNYVGYSAKTTDGRVLAGILETETVTSITLKQPEGKTVVLSRDEIEVLRSEGVSLMPEGVEKNISPKQMADLIAFLKNWRYLDGAIPMSDGQ